MKTNKIIRLSALLAASTLLLAGCGGSEKAVSYKDGIYTGQSSVYTNDDGTEDGNGYGVVELTIEGGVITACTYQTFETDGKLKDENYGKKDGEVANRDYFNKAQKAVAACDQYAAKLVEKGSLKGIDAISGATINYTEFKEAVTEALSQAEAEQ